MGTRQATHQDGSVGKRKYDSKLKVVNAENNQELMVTETPMESLPVEESNAC